MNILMIAPQPFFTYRGTPFSVYYRLLTLSELGHKVDLVTYHLGEDIILDGLTIYRSWKFPFVKNIKIGPSFIKIFVNIPLFFKVLLILIKKRKEYKIIYVHEEAVMFGVLFKKLFKKKLIYDMHSSLPQQFENFNFCNFRLIKSIFRWIEKKGISHSDFVITICEDFDKKAKEYGCSNTELIPNTRFDIISGIQFKKDVNKYSFVEQFLKKEKKEKKEKIIYYCGTFEDYQGIPMLLEAFKYVNKKVNNTKLLLIGGYNQQVEKMKKYAEELGISHLVLFTGMLDPNYVKKTLKRIDILTSPRDSGTNTPLKIYEYIASGIPIVATNIYSHTQLLNSDIAFLANPDHIDFARAILECIQNDRVAQEKALNAKNLYAEKYGTEKYKQKLQKVIESVSVYS